MTREEFINGLREAASIYERHPEIPIPSDLDLLSYMGGKTHRERFALAARALGKTRKEYDETYLTLERILAGTTNYGVRMRIFIDREAVCRRVVTEEVVPATPARTVELPAEPEKVVKKVSWECAEPILSAAVEESEETAVAP